MGNICSTFAFLYQHCIHCKANKNKGPLFGYFFGKRGQELHTHARYAVYNYDIAALWNSMRVVTELNLFVN